WCRPSRECFLVCGHPGARRRRHDHQWSCCVWSGTGGLHPPALDHLPTRPRVLRAASASVRAPPWQLPTARSCGAAWSPRVGLEGPRPPRSWEGAWPPSRWGAPWSWWSRALRRLEVGPCRPRQPIATPAGVAQRRLLPPSKEPSTPRTSSRPTEEPMVRAADLATVSKTESLRPLPLKRPPATSPSHELSLAGGGGAGGRGRPLPERTAASASSRIDSVGV